MHKKKQKASVYVQLINSKASLSVKNAVASVLGSHTRSAFHPSSPPPLLFSAPLPYIKSLIFIHSDLTFQLESSPPPAHRATAGRWLKMATSILMTFTKCRSVFLRCAAFRMCVMIVTWHHTASGITWPAGQVKSMGLRSRHNFHPKKRAGESRRVEQEFR